MPNALPGECAETVDRAGMIERRKGTECCELDRLNCDVAENVRIRFYC
jgi:hypothetical protein